MKASWRLRDFRSKTRDGPMRRRSAMRWSWRQGRPRPSSPGPGSAGPARGERACLVDVLGEVDLLPGLALDRKSLAVVIGSTALDGTKQPASVALRRPHHQHQFLSAQQTRHNPTAPHTTTYRCEIP